MGSNYFAENPTERVAMSPENGGGIVFADSLGNTVSSISAGSEITFVTSFKNLQGTAQQYLYIVEVFNSQGIVVDLDTFTGTMQAGEALTLKEGSFTAEGEAGELDPEDEAMLQRYVAAVPVPDERLAALANARAEAVREIATRDFGVAPEKLEIGEPAPTGDPGVVLELAAAEG